MGSIYNRGTTREPKFYARFQDVDGKYKSRFTKQPTKAMAYKRLAHAEALVAAGQSGLLAFQEAPVPASPTFREVAEAWLKHYSQAYCRSHMENKLRLQKHIYPVLGAVPADELTTAHVRRFVATKGLEICSRLKRPLAPQTINHLLKLIKQILDSAVESRVAAHNVARRIRPLPIPEVDYEILLSDEIERLLRQAKPDLEPLFVAAVHTGCRRGELCGLKWGDIDVELGGSTFDARTQVLPKTERSSGCP